MVLPGFNTDFKYKGLVYHAQTEDNGASNPVVVTLLYLRGAILASKKTSYEDLVNRGNFRKDVMQLMKAQHRDIMKEVLSGTYDRSGGTTAAEEAPAKEVPAEAAPAEEVPAEETASGGPISLDRAIMEFLDSFETGKTPVM